MQVAQPKQRVVPLRRRHAVVGHLRVRERRDLLFGPRGLRGDVDVQAGQVRGGEEALLAPCCGGGGGGELRGGYGEDGAELCGEERERGQ